MEFLAGEDLCARMERWGAIALDEAAGILSQVLEALSAVHSCGVVHRDLKPENIFIARQSGGDEIIKILDFGVSRLTEAETPGSRITKSGFVYGTPYYIAPEQAEGRTTVDHRADLYSAGTIFFEMVTGRLPFPTKAYGKLLVEIITKPPPDPSIHVPNLPRSVKELILTSLAKDPNERFQSADEMLRELRSIDMRTLRESKAAPGKAKTAGRTPFPGKPAARPIVDASARIQRLLSDPMLQKAAGPQAGMDKPGADAGPRKPSTGAYRMLGGAVEKVAPGSPGVSKSPPKKPPAFTKTSRGGKPTPRIPRPAAGPASPADYRKPSNDVDQAWTVEKDEDEAGSKKKKP
jgi:serine/threonine protein kinase